MSIIDDIARLVLEDPNSSAREIAKDLGYSEPKSVYYWLKKGGFKGLKEFRQAVLRGQYPVVPPKNAEKVKDSTELSVPIYDDEEQLPLGDLAGLLSRTTGDRVFGVVVSRKDFWPEAVVGDILFIDPEASIGQGDLVAANVKGKMVLVRTYVAPDSDKTIYISVNVKKGMVFPELIVGKVVHLLKRF